MEISTAFQVSVFFLTVLTLSRPFATFASQTPGQIEPERRATEDENAVRLETELTAKQDAHRDINKLFWLGTGVGIFCLAIFCGISGCFVGSIIVPPENTFGFMPMIEFSNWGIAIGCAGFVSGALIPFIGIHRAGVNPPPDRHLDSSPELVEFYSNVYGAEMRFLRLRWAITGVGAVTGGLLLLGFLSNL